jgi:hypothetical protein
VFITGEAGIGKTSVVERFLTDVGSSGQVSIARGHCVEHHGSAEAYMPVLEALGRLGWQVDGQSLVETLDRFAPSWLVQMPGLVRPDQLPALHQRLLGQTRERMLREIEEALVVATAVTPIVLVLEDLHWTDLSTLDLLTRLARGQDAARLLLIGTYRAPDALATSHPLFAAVQELRLRGACHHLPLAPLSRASIAAYLHDRGGGAVPPGVVDLIQQRTEGSPLRRQPTRQPRGSDHPDQQATKGHRQPLSEDQSQDIRRPRAERRTDREFARPQRQGVRQKAEEADSRDDQREPREAAEQQRIQPWSRQGRE